MPLTQTVIRSLWLWLLVAPARPQPRNVVHVVFDDFRTDLPIYGQAFVHAPAFSALAARGVVFDRAYCSIAVCNPSRNSFLTGRLPSQTLVWNFFDHVRQARCEGSQVQGEFLEGTVLSSWTEFDPENSGGVAGCCTSCTGAGAGQCAGWHYRNKTCTTFSSVTATRQCPAPGKIDPWSGQPFSCVRGGAGAFPTITTLPQRFREAGHLTLGVGKLWHDGGGGYGSGDPTDAAHPAGPGTPPLADPLSWSASPAQYEQNCTFEGLQVACPALGIPSFLNAYPANAFERGSAYFTPAFDDCNCSSADTTCIPLSNASEAHLSNQGCTIDVGPDGLGAATPLIDVPVQIDARFKLRAAALNFNATGQPFFVEIGFKKPHLNWKVPKHYVDDLYPRGDFTPRLPKNRTLDASISPMSWTPWWTASPYEALSVNTTLEMRRYYYAAVSWADFHLGQVLDELDALGIADQTAVAVHGDHGFHLGENSAWEKRTLWEAATRVPFVLAVPWLPQSHGQRAAAPVELVDVMPTLLDLAGVSPPPGDSLPLDGESLVPLLLDPTRPALPGRSVARSTYPRCPRHGAAIWNDSCIHTVERTLFPYMGYSIRDTGWRFTAFFAWNGTSLSPNRPLATYSTELYDHRSDVPGGPDFEPNDFYEDVNVADLYPDVAQAMLAELKTQFGL
jgi:hypothetical protein